jgi:hypothetical protein
VLKDLVIDLEVEVEEREKAQGPLDFKRLLKSEKEVRVLTKDVMTSYLKAVRRTPSMSFAAHWDQAQRRIPVEPALALD